MGQIGHGQGAGVGRLLVAKALWRGLGEAFVRVERAERARRLPVTDLRLGDPDIGIRPGQHRARRQIIGQRSLQSGKGGGVPVQVSQTRQLQGALRNPLEVTPLFRPIPRGLSKRARRVPLVQEQTFDG